MMGSPPSERGRDLHEGPQHEVSITRGFWLADTPVTKALYEAIVGPKPSRFSRSGSSSAPVESVSWNEALDISEQLQRRLEDEVGPLNGQAVRLPTEAEWEYACRAGTTGPTYAPAGKHLSDIAWVAANAGGSTQRVRGRLPNPWGLFDMLGNVWEWCADACGLGQPYPGGPRTNPLGQEGADRALRGGSFIRGGGAPRAAMRRSNRPDYRDHALGLRLCIGPPLPDRA
jgi:formylglycine-generating enzyme required for sulfatase activity